MSTGSQQGGYNSRNMKKRMAFKKEEEKYHSAILDGVKYAKFSQPVLGIIAAIWLTPWALIPFAAMFLVLHKFSQEDLKKEGWKKYIKIAAFFIFSAITIVFLACYLLENFVVLLLVMAVQIGVVVYLKKKVDEYRAFL